MRNYDLLVVGGGTAGLTTAIRTAKADWRVAVFEGAVHGSDLGGTCINTGCIPARTLVEAALVRRCARGAGRFGSRMEDRGFDYAVARERARQMILRHREERERDVAAAGVTVVRERAVFRDGRTLLAGGREFSAERIVIATGARPRVPPIPGLETVEYLTSTTALRLDSLPGSMLVAGGGPVAVQFAQLYAGFGVEVTLLQGAERLLPGVDADLAEELRLLLIRDGITILTGARLERVEPSRRGVAAFVRRAEGVERLEAESLLLGVGRQPNTDGMGLEEIGVRLDERGFVVVDDAFESSVPGVYAIGDSIGGAMFTNRAWHDAILLSRFLLFDEKISRRGRLVPFAVATDPELAAVGLGEDAARERGVRIRVSRQPFSAVTRAQAMGREDGLVKLISEADTGRLLGAQILGPGAGELIHEPALGIRLGATLFDLQDLIHVHPTLAEGVNGAAEN